VVRGVVPPVIKIGLTAWPNPIAAGLTGYIFSTLTVLAIERIRTGRFVAQAPLPGRLWFAANGICNGTGTLLLYAALGAGPVSLVAPLYATYPLFTVGLSVLFLGNVKITFRLIAGTLLTVGGVVLVLAG
jgi:drug/metabolite transporter (DMT)-like permease